MAADSSAVYRLMYDYTQAICLHLKEAGVATRVCKRGYPYQFNACWDHNWYGVYVDHHGYAWVEPLSYSKKTKRYVSILDGNDIWRRCFELADPNSLLKIVRYIKHKRKARGRFV